MKASIAHTFVYNLIIVFILIVFGVLAAAVNYYKAFKVNNMVIASIEKCEGYNDCSIGEISNTLDAMGYIVDDNFTSSDCPKRKNATNVTAVPSHRICIYEYDDTLYVSDTKTGTYRAEEEGSYYKYSVMSYIYIDLPLIEAFDIPIHTRAERIYKFSETGGGDA